MKKYIFCAVCMLNSNIAIGYAPPTACPAGEFAYTLPAAISVSYSCDTTTQLSSEFGAIFYSMLIADANTPYSDDTGIYEYANYVCIYR